MSRHEVTNKDGTVFVYGYDRPTSQYFLDAKSTQDGETIYLPWVGFDSAKREWSRGTHVNMLEAMEHFGIWDLIHPSHARAIVLDLPISEEHLHFKIIGVDPDGDRDYPGAITPMPKRRSKRVPFVPKSEDPHGSRDTFVPHPDGPDGERFNAMQD